eukprot:GHVN01075944.1.p1 GENE.GHVN01075944.1~~GHVN01075944.1.p1  ORF type:complete len:252 (+),score=54.22 GHVN01075944.1:63-818(+)
MVANRFKSTPKKGEKRDKRTAAEELTAEAKAKRAEDAKRVTTHPLFEKRPKNFNIGGTVQPKRDLTRYVRWPKYIRLQRQRRILVQRLKVPPALNLFNNGIDKNQATQVLRLFAKYKPETNVEKKGRLTEQAQARKDNKELDTKKPILIKYGLSHVTDLIELNRAKLVLIAHDVNPIELVCWLPALCRKKDIPYCIIKGKVRQMKELSAVLELVEANAMSEVGPADGSSSKRKQPSTYRLPHSQPTSLAPI